jgi:hypothetical protein
MTQFVHQPLWWKPKTERKLTVTAYWLHCVRYSGWGSTVPPCHRSDARTPIGHSGCTAILHPWLDDSLTSREPWNSGLQQSVITRFHFDVSKIRDWFRRIGMRPHAWQFDFPHFCCYADHSQQRFRVWCLLYVPPSLGFRNSTVFPQNVFMCFVWFWEQVVVVSV